MKCYFCQKSLYKNIDFSNIFQIKYEVHNRCYNQNKVNDSVVSFPLLNKIIHINAVFNIFQDNFDENSLFRVYGNILFKQILNNQIDHFIFLDERDKTHISQTVLELILPMFGREIYFFSLFQSSIIRL